MRNQQRVVKPPRVAMLASKPSQRATATKTEIPKLSTRVIPDFEKLHQQEFSKMQDVGMMTPSRFQKLKLIQVILSNRKTPGKNN
jgi:hypothetical protein